MFKVKNKMHSVKTSVLKLNKTNHVAKHTIHFNYRSRPLIDIYKIYRLSSDLTGAKIADIDLP